MARKSKSQSINLQTESREEKLNMSKANATLEKIVVKTKAEEEADRKFILAMVVIIAFVIMLLVPLATNNSTLFTTVATAMSGLVGTIIGYYFGSEKTQQPPK
jgi:hypothetical protein